MGRARREATCELPELCVSLVYAPGFRVECRPVAISAASLAPLLARHWRRHGPQAPGRGARGCGQTRARVGPRGARKHARLAAVLPLVALWRIER